MKKFKIKLIKKPETPTNLTDRMRAEQIMYNIAMNKLESERQKYIAQTKNQPFMFTTF